MPTMETCPIPDRRDRTAASRQHARLQIIAEKWEDGDDPYEIMREYGATYDGMKSMIRSNPDVHIPDIMRKQMHKVARTVYPKGKKSQNKSNWEQYEKEYYTHEILFLNQYNTPAIEILDRLDVSWAMWKQIITENHLTRLQNETYNACRWHYLKQQHPDWTDQQITQARRASESSFNDFMQDDRPAL